MIIPCLTMRGGLPMQDVVRIIEEGGRAGGGSKADTERFEKLVPNTS